MLLKLGNEDAKMVKMVKIHLNPLKDRFFFPRIGAKPQCLRRLAYIQKYNVCDHNIHYLSSTNLVLDEKKILGSQKLLTFVNTRSKIEKMKKTASKGVVLGVGVNPPKMTKKIKNFAIFK